MRKILILLLFPIFCQAQTPITWQNGDAILNEYGDTIAIIITDSTAYADTIPLPGAVINIQTKDFRDSIIINPAFLDSIHQREDSLLLKIDLLKTLVLIDEMQISIYKKLYEELKEQLEAEKQKNKITFSQ